MGSRTWIKIYCDKWLNGTIREESPEVRGVWVDLLALAGSGTYGDSGEIKITETIGFFDGQLAELLQISRQKWATIKQKLIHTDRIIIKNRNIIAIKNWTKYQSEYERQKDYRQTQSTIDEHTVNCNPELQSEVTIESTAREGEGRGEIENIHNKEKDIKRKFGEFQNVLLIDEEYQKLKGRLNSRHDEYIERLSGYLKQTGKRKYKDHYATILNWHRKDSEEAKSGKNRNPRLLKGKKYSDAPDYEDL